jgi:hypothetical protein
MSKTAPKPAKTAAAELAEAIIEVTAKQLALVLGRNYPEIQRILEKDKEIKISAGITITDRPATEGNQASKDNRIRVAISFAEKFSDSTETELPDPSQTEFAIVE